MPRPSPQTDRVVKLLGALASNPSAGMTVAQIARRLGVNKATCYPMLAALQGSGWLVRHPVRRTFHLGPSLVPLGQAAAVGLPRSELVHATLEELSAELEVCCLAIAPAQDHVVVVDVAVPAGGHSPVLRPGQKIPLRPPWGAVFVAWAEPDAAQRWLAHADPADRPRWSGVLDAVRSIAVVVELDEQFVRRQRDVPAVEPSLATATSPVDATDPSTEFDSMAERFSRQPQAVLTDLGGDQTQPVVSINAPVRSGGDRTNGEVTMALAAMGFAELLTADRVRAIAERIRLAADALS